MTKRRVNVPKRVLMVRAYLACKWPPTREALLRVNDEFGAFREGYEEGYADGYAARGREGVYTPGIISE